MKAKRISALVAGGFLSLIAATLVLAQGQGSYDENRNWPSMQIQTRVESHRDGVTIQITIHQTIPGHNGEQASAGQETAGSDPPAPARPDRSSAGAANQAASTAPRERVWSNPTGIFRETVDGHIISLTPPMIGAASQASWDTLLQQHPNETPYLLNVDGRFDRVIWIPQNSGTPNLAEQTTTTDSRPGPSGDDHSTDAREVALDALGHVSLPNIHLRMNPALGLVNLSGWFWVEGYNGRPFGVSRTVHVPPEVGSDVPETEVPADDPRRRSTSYTVEVRLWPDHYQWDFGDGADLVTHSLGQAHPAESDIRHTYEHSSLGFPDGFPIRLTVQFNAEYRINGGPAIGLPPIVHTYTTGYRVQEMQAILTRQ
ncbi:MAG: hypothetical protein U0822_08275 [Anaerolineae bacterium]